MVAEQQHTTVWYSGSGSKRVVGKARKFICVLECWLPGWDCWYLYCWAHPRLNFVPSPESLLLAVHSKRKDVVYNQA